MKHMFLLPAFLILFHTILYSQGCLPEGITFTTQEQIDNFQANYPGCTEIEGNVFIGLETGNLNIMNFQGLSTIDKINGSLDIIGCLSIGELSGLNALTEVGESLEIKSCTELDNLSGLNSLTHVDGGLKIALNNVLTSIEALESLTGINGDLSIIGNVSLNCLEGLSSLILVPGSIFINNNSCLTDITALQNINPDSIQGWLAIMGNYSLSDCAIQSICSYLQIPNGLVYITSNASGCNNLSEVQQACMTSIEQFSDQPEISLLPNPATSFITITVQGDFPVKETIIFNYLGQKALVAVPVNNTVDVSKLKPGIYFLEVITSESRMRTKIVIE